MGLRRENKNNVMNIICGKSLLTLGAKYNTMLDSRSIVLDDKVGSSGSETGSRNSDGGGDIPDL